MTALVCALLGCGDDRSPELLPTQSAARPPAAPQVTFQAKAAIEEIQLPGADPSPPDWIGKHPGEPFDVLAYWRSRDVENNEGASWYYWGLAELSPEMSFVFPAEERASRVEQSELLEARITELSDPGDLAADLKSLAHVKAVIDQAQEAIDKIDRGQAFPECVFVTGRAVDAAIPHLQSMRQLARLHVMHAWYRGKAGDHAASQRSLARTLRASRDVRRRCAMIGQLESLAMDGLVLSSIRDLTLGRFGLTAEDCDRLAELLDEHVERALPAADEGIRAEYIQFRNTLHGLAEGRITAEQLEVPAGIVDVDAELTIANEFFAMGLHRANMPYHELIASTTDELDELLRQPRTFGTLCQDLLPGITPAIKSANRAANDLAATRALIAVRRYELTHGKLPGTLSDAFAEPSPKIVPLDVYSGQPIKYVVTGGRPVVYSVGSDQKDDRGRIRSIGERTPGDLVFTYARK